MSFTNAWNNSTPANSDDASLGAAVIRGLKGDIQERVDFTVVNTAISYICTIADGIILVDATTGNLTVTLPAALGSGGKKVTVIKVDVSSNTVTIIPAGADTITQALVLTKPGNLFKVLSDNVSNWYSETLSYPSTDNSGISADVTLARGETSFYKFTGVTNLPLHIATATDQMYEITIVFDIVSPGGAGFTTLQPNNITYTSAMTLHTITASDNVMSPGSAVFSVFAIGMGGSSFMSICQVSTRITAKYVSTILDQSITSGSNINIGQGFSYWNDSTTAWTSLGTLHFNTGSGMATVRRIL